MLRPFPLRELNLRHRGHCRSSPDDSLRLSGCATGVGDRHDVIGGKISCFERLGLEPLRFSDHIAGDLREFRWNRAQREHLLETVDTLEEGGRALDEHRHRVDHQGGDLRVAQHICMVVERSERMQSTASPTLGLSRSDDQQDLWAVESQQADRTARSGTE